MEYFVWKRNRNFVNNKTAGNNHSAQKESNLFKAEGMNETDEELARRERKAQSIYPSVALVICPMYTCAWWNKVYTVFIRISAAAPIKVFVIQVWRLSRGRRLFKIQIKNFFALQEFWRGSFVEEHYTQLELKMLFMKVSFRSSCELDCIYDRFLYSSEFGIYWYTLL